jgi:hypothetical protein
MQNALTSWFDTKVHMQVSVSTVYITTEHIFCGSPYLGRNKSSSRSWRRCIPHRDKLLILTNKHFSLSAPTVCQR